MNRQNRRALAERIDEAAEAALAARHYVRPLDVLAAIGWLYPGAVEPQALVQARREVARRRLAPRAADDGSS